MSSGLYGEKRSDAHEDTREIKAWTKRPGIIVGAFDATVRRASAWTGSLIIDKMVQASEHCRIGVLPPRTKCPRKAAAFLVGEATTVCPGAFLAYRKRT